MKSEENEGAVSTVLGDYILRWGIWGIAAILSFAAAMNAKDFEKYRMEKLSEKGDIVDTQIIEVREQCLRDISFILEQNKLMDKQTKEILELLSSKDFKLNHKVLNSIYSKNNEVFYKIKLCEKKIEDLSRFEVIK